MVTVAPDSDIEELSFETPPRSPHRAGAVGMTIVLMALVGAAGLALHSQAASQSLNSHATFAVELAEVWRRNDTDLRLTRNGYPDSGHAEACSLEYGPSYRTADWAYNLLDLDVGQLTEMCQTLEIPATFNARYYFVTNEGKTFWDGSQRAFFFERHDGHPPSNWLVHDTHGAITLGSWTEIAGPVLCARKESVAASNQAGWTRHPDTFLGRYAGDFSEVMKLELAKAKCIELGRACFGVTCGYDAVDGTGHSGMVVAEESCTVRAGLCDGFAEGCPSGRRRGLQRSPTDEVSYVKEEEDTMLV